MQVQPSQISPAEPFDIFYFLRNPVDNATYYIRAVIYDVRTGRTITTVTLSQSTANPHLFIATLQAPPDPVGIGRNIVAVASVYTDSGYTTKSDAYEEQESYFLIKPQPFFGGGGGVDYGVVREIIGEELDKRKPKDPPSLPDMPFDAIFGALGALQREINRIPKEGSDSAPILNAIEGVRTAISGLPKPEPVDLSALADLGFEIDRLRTQVEGLPSGLSEPILKMSTGVQAAIKAGLKEIEANLETRLTDVIESQEITIPVSRSTKSSASRQPASPPLTDVSHLMRS